MNILIDTSPLINANSIRGVGRYTRELVRALKELPTQHQFFTTEDRQQKIDIVHYPYFDLFFHTLPIVRRARTVVTIHDVIPLIFTKNYKPGIKGRISFQLQKVALNSVSHIITDSSASKRDIHEKLRIPLEKITPVPLAASADMQKPTQAVLDQVKKRYQLPKTYLLYVGDINYNKNIPFLLRVVKRIPRLHLVLAGKQMNNTTIPEGAEIHRAIETLGIADRVLCIDSLDGERSGDLVALYSLATAYIQPSLYEGFGLPVIEAMQCRTPILSSLGGSLPEVVNTAGIFFHPRDEDECEQAIRKMLRLNATQRSKLIRLGVERAQEFSWEKTAQQTLSVYESVFAAGT